MFPQQQSSADAVAVTSLVDAAALVETRLRDADLRGQALQRELSQAQARADSARRWILTIRRDHRGKSHNRTGRTIKRRSPVSTLARHRSAHG